MVFAPSSHGSAVAPSVKPVYGRVVRAAVILAVSATAAHGQIDAIRRARAELSGKLPNIGSLFGDQPPLTTSVDDAVDGVPQLDGFEPASFSPLVEMPRGINGRFFLAPGSYTFDAESYCLKAGTYGPKKGDGYLYAELKGPKSAIIRNILLRVSDHPEVARGEAQGLLWSILVRAKYDKMPSSVQRAARALLTQSELREIGNNGLDVVPDEVRNRALQSVAPPLRRVFEAENEMRRLLSGPNATFEDLERVAVLTGEPPLEELTAVVREGRWSYHPNGFFIRYHTEFYSATRIQVYYPAAFRVERDAKGRIISVTTEDGRRAERGTRATNPTRRTDAPLWITVASRARMPGRSLDTRDLVRIALTDVADLAAFRRSLDTLRSRKAAEMSAMVREAEHAALARYYGLRKQSSMLTLDRLTETLRPERTSHGFSYVVAPLSPTINGVSMQSGGKPLNQFPPGGGGSVPGNSKQRQGSSARSSSPNAANKAQKATKAMQTASSLLGPLGGGGLPNAMVGAGLNQAFKAAGGIDGALNGEEMKDDAAMTSAAVTTNDATSAPIWTNVSLRTVGARRAVAHKQTPDFMVLSKPVDVEVPVASVTPGVVDNRAAATSAVVNSTLRLASTLTAAGLAKRRLIAAGKAKNDEWENRQARAFLHLRRAAGETMLALARDLAAYRAIAASNPAAEVTAAQATDAQRQLASGFPPDVVSTMRRLGMTDAALETYRQELLAVSAGVSAASAPAVLLELEGVMKEYGEYWTTLPIVSAPWN